MRLQEFKSRVLEEKNECTAQMTLLLTTAALTTDTFMRLQEYKRRALEEKDGLTVQMKALKEEVLSLLALLYEALNYWCVRPYGSR
jgi:hypothetical protein